jgi:hypothetical protein
MWQSVVIKGRVVVMCAILPPNAMMVNAVEQPDRGEAAMAISTHQEVADRWVEGLRGDWSILEELAAPAMRVWHSFDNAWLERADAEARMADAGSQASLAHLEDIRTVATEHGFIVQASLEGGGDGAARTHIVQILTVVDGLIATCEEYVAPEAVT